MHSYLQLVLHVLHLRYNSLVLPNLPIQQTQLVPKVSLQTEKHDKFGSFKQRNTHRSQRVAFKFSTEPSLKDRLLG